VRWEKKVEHYYAMLDLNRTTGDWHRKELADTSVVATSIEPPVRDSCAKNDRS
jgi:hypothetical protein